MALNDTPAANRTHIAFFGKRNAGKSSLLNAVTNQDIAVVSDIKGTTTDPVFKTMEILPIGPVMLIDTPGFDDDGMLGALRVKKARQVLNKTDIAVLVADACEIAAENGKLSKQETEILDIIKSKNIPYVIAYNKCDAVQISGNNFNTDSSDSVFVSAITGSGINEFKEHLGKIAVSQADNKHIVSDLISPGDLVVMVTPIDNAAPKGRLILPQQITLRDILDADASAVVVKETQLKNTLAMLKNKPALVITDSQAFAAVNKETPRDVPLTSFSILMARFKGFLNTAVEGAAAIDSLKDGDTVLIAEGCTHHRQCNDIGTVKIPNWLYKYTGKSINIRTCSGGDFPEDLSEYSLIIHCGGCMLNEREVLYRMKSAADFKIPFTNYGITIAKMTGILERSIEIFAGRQK